MKLRSGKLFFIPGLCWGGLWIKEFFLYPELWFFAYCAVGVGVGFLAAGWLKQKYRDIAGVAALMVLALLPWAELHSALFPLVFGFFSSWMLNENSENWQHIRSFSGGFMLGAVVEIIIPDAWFIPLLLFCCAIFFPAIWKKLVTVTAAFAIMIWGSVIVEHRSEVPEVPVIYPGATICAVSWIEPDGKPPVVAFLGGDHDITKMLAKEFIAETQFSCHDTVSAIQRDTDLIFIMTRSNISDGGVRECARKLKDGGVLVVPVSECGVLPDWKWLELPGSNGHYAVAGKNRQLRLDPDKMDDNFSSLFHKSKNPPLAGALAGMLVTEEEKAITIPPHKDSRMIWLGGLIALSAVLVWELLRQLKESAHRKDMFSSMLNTGGFALLTAVLLPLLLEFCGLPGIINALIALGAVWFIRRSAGKRNAAGKNILWLMFFITMLLGIVYNMEIFMFAAFVCGGSGYTDLDGELQTGLSPRFEPVRYLAIACGIGAAWMLMAFNVPLMYQLLIALGVRFYSWLRN